MQQRTSIIDFSWKFDCNFGNYNFLIKIFGEFPKNLDSTPNEFHNTKDLFGVEFNLTYIPDEKIKNENQVPKFEHEVI